MINLFLTNFPIENEKILLYFAQNSKAFQCRLLRQRDDLGLCVLAQTVNSQVAIVESTWCASVRGKKVTLRTGRKGGLHEENDDDCGITRYDKCLLGGIRSRSNSRPVGSCWRCLA
jgi:hypothetical protein